MEVSVAKLSQNGQIVIPSEIRNAAKLKPATRFLVITKDGDIILKQIRAEDIDQKVVKMQKSSKKIESIADVYA